MDFWMVTLTPITPALKRPSRILVFSAFSGTRPPQKPVNAKLFQKLYTLHGVCQIMVCSSYQHQRKVSS